MHGICCFPEISLTFRPFCLYIIHLMHLGFISCRRRKYKFDSLSVSFVEFDMTTTNNTTTIILVYIDRMNKCQEPLNEHIFKYLHAQSSFFLFWVKFQNLIKNESRINLLHIIYKDFLPSLLSLQAIHSEKQFCVSKLFVYFHLLKLKIVH